MTISLHKIWAWIVYSSQDSTKISLTVKSALTGLITALTVAAGLANIHLPSAELTALVDSIVFLIQSLLLLVSSALAAWGLIRKIATSFTKDNKVVNEHEAFNQ